MLIIGIDPGSRVTGYGIIRVAAQTIQYVDSGCINTTKPDIPSRLAEISAGLKSQLHIYPIEQAAIEEVFMHRNADSALKLGHARGAAITTMVNQHLPVSEYSPRQIKQSVVGKGGADKFQVEHMIRLLLNIQNQPLKADESDALAVALCHAHTMQGLSKLAGVTRFSRGRLK